MQIMSDVLDLPVCAAAATEATSRGAALLVLEQLGAISSLSSADTPLGATYRPREQAREVYAKAMRRQEMLYDLLIRRQAKDEDLRAAISGHVIDTREKQRRASESAKHYRPHPDT
jgi:glycerol kinase